MQNPLFTFDGLYQAFRWIHFLAGVVWIGHLYYFNFVQGAFFAETDAQTKSTAIRQLVPKALWWFRWGAAFTFFSGLGMLWHKYSLAGAEIFNTSWGIWIVMGTLLGSLMAFNVWFVIWPNQKIVIASANAVASGGQADPRAAGAGARALTASRTNVLFSVPMLFFMGAASHLTLIMSPEFNPGRVHSVLGTIILLLEANALFGKTGPMATVKGVITSGFILTAILYVAVCALV